VALDPRSGATIVINNSYRNGKRGDFMSDPNEKRNQTQSSGQQGERQAGQQMQSGQRSGAMQAREQGQRGGRMARRGSFAPSMFALSPSAVLSMSPFELMRRFTDELDRVFEGLGIARGAGGAEIQMWTPSVEIFERDNNLVVRAELPGLDKDDVKVELTDDGLVIEGERKRESEERLEGGYRSEIEYGRFYRLIPLPEGVNVDQAQARINNGVLEVAIPIAEARRPRRSIPVETGAGQAPRTAGEQAQTATGGAGRR
jgi:HSP20 family protein